MAPARLLNSPCTEYSPARCGNAPPASRRAVPRRRHVWTAPGLQGVFLAGVLHVAARVRSCVRPLRCGRRPLAMMLSADEVPIIPTGSKPDDGIGLSSSAFPEARLSILLAPLQHVRLPAADPPLALLSTSRDISLCGGASPAGSVVVGSRRQRDREQMRPLWGSARAARSVRKTRRPQPTGHSC
jgi:hypothetical protein